LIYLDTSVALAHLLSEDVRPPRRLWSEPIVSSRLLEYELMNRLHSRGLESSHGSAARSLLATVSLLELAPPVLARALEPFPIPVRTLDALHLASLDFLRRAGQRVHLATYDQRMLEAARALGFPLADLGAPPGH